MVFQWVKRLVGDTNERELKKLWPLVEQISALEPDFEKLDNQALRAKTAEFKARLQNGETLDDLLGEAFAAVREAAKRTLGQRPFEVQLLGGIVLHQGKIAEMKTGEGKTLVATLPLYLNALSGQGAHLVTVNDYLARRDTQWMGPIYHLLGLSVGLLQPGDKDAYVYDPDFALATADLKGLRAGPRAEAYRADITYGTNHEFGFDYLRDNMVPDLSRGVQRGLHYAIVDEVDNILIDEARTPLIISGPSAMPVGEYYHLADVVHRLSPSDVQIDEKARTAVLTDEGYQKVNTLLGGKLFSEDQEEGEMSRPEQGRLLHHLEQALKARFLFREGHHYIVQSGQVIIVDEFTGRLMPGRRYSDGLHQAIEAKERGRVQPESVTYATITLQNYFRMYHKLAGMTGTAATETEEFHKIYNLDVVVIPTHRPMIRLDSPDQIYKTEEAKLRAETLEILSLHSQGRPVLVGTTSVELSEHLSHRLSGDKLRLLALCLLVREALNHENGLDKKQLTEVRTLLNSKLESLNADSLAKSARQLGLNPSLLTPENLATLAGRLKLEDREALAQGLTQGVPHNVLNAKEHAKEGKIIARAGERGAVTLATNMAGRGVDIMLGGVIPEEAYEKTRQILQKKGLNPFQVSREEWERALAEADPTYAAQRQQILALGGLHVIGTERHEARRIDNQLRGRAGRQGEPGSTRFYASFEDELMRRLGTERFNTIIDRLAPYQDDLVLEDKMLTRLIEGAQASIEGYHFDIRKHLVEYDDVLNQQRQAIYGLRRRLLSPADRAESLEKMIEEEVDRLLAPVSEEGEGRIPLLGRLEQILPPLPRPDGSLIPTFAMHLILQDLAEGEPQAMRLKLREVAQQAISLERTHLLEAGTRLLEQEIARYEENRSALLDKAKEAMQALEEESALANRALDPRLLTKKVSEVVGLPLTLPLGDLRHLDSGELKRKTLEAVGSAYSASRSRYLLAGLESRYNLTLGIKASDLDPLGPEEAKETLLDRALATFGQQAERRLAQFERDMEERVAQFERDHSGQTCPYYLLARWLFDATYAPRAVFDRQHRQRGIMAQRLSLVPVAAHRLEGASREQMREQVLAYFHQVLDTLAQDLGEGEITRLGHLRPGDLEAPVSSYLREHLGAEMADEVAPIKLSEMREEVRREVALWLGRWSLQQVQRGLMLRIMDTLWIDYLTSIEELRTGIGLQAYGQRDPLVEYKRQAYDMFQGLLRRINQIVMENFFRNCVQGAGQVKVAKRPAASPQSEAEAPQAKSVGRNDPCPCGSGKKYKRCCGR